MAPDKPASEAIERKRELAEFKARLAEMTNEFAGKLRAMLKISSYA